MEYFLSEDKCTTITTNTYFRSQAAAKKVAQNAQKTKLEYAVKLYEVLLNYVDFPTLHLTLPMGMFADSNALSTYDMSEVQDKIENLARSLRKSWGLGNGPIDDLQYRMEAN